MQQRSNTIPPLTRVPEQNKKKGGWKKKSAERYDKAGSIIGGGTATLETRG